ncbi:glucokinase [Rubinisphaera sp.]|uniref:glucokinase n=1 Tax=Rubinisphaera sp. TaxID=2024857 RepID=UPI000C115A90|nr:glucokinase [Rubinisphaera sp.]MBV10943.1 glucokinase [Rubinisphaera sp.]HCS52225.1 glucokinase [Planctomycetaceae bacterium]|tara:strand:- start:2644 stop:3630 length:987 start_codon:yes stop_codon:yes gene_type:complete
MLLAGDIGGTKTVLALFDESNPKAIIKEQRYVSKDYEGLDVIVRKFLQDNPCEVVSACFGVAGPVDNGKCKTTNLPWMVDEAVLAECVGTKKTRVVNDLEAMAWSVEILDKDDLVCIHKGREIDDNRGVIAAGTGLGEAGIWYGTRYHPFGSEGGHADFSPKSHEEDALLSFLRNKFQNVSWERVLSGPGIENIFEFLVNTYREKPAEHVVEKMKEEIPAAVITAAALARECPACIRTMEMFVGLYGAEAGNLALKLMAFGGMYIGGGIAPKILPLLDSDTFRDAFLRKGRFRDALSRIPIYVIMTSKAPLLGAAHVADLLAHDQPIF